MTETIYYEALDTFSNKGLTTPSVHAVMCRPGVGLTKWALKQAFYTSKKGANTLFISLESVIQDNIEKLFDMFGKEEIAQHPMNTLHLVEAVNANVQTLGRMIEKNVEINAVQVVWIDSLEYIFSANGSEIMTEEDYLEVVTALDDLANKLHITILFTKQLNRIIEKREDKRPLLSDFKPKAVTAYVSSVIGLYRDALYNEEIEETNTIEVRLLKDEDDESVKIYEENLQKTKQA